MIADRALEKDYFSGAWFDEDFEDFDGEIRAAVLARLPDIGLIALSSGLNPTYGSHTIPFPGFPAGERPQAMPEHRQAGSTPREAGIGVPYVRFYPLVALWHSPAEA